ncbi:TcpQ domain-containing protein [Pandoraea terrae]|uniref:TcpQ domain-containing protein n=1 Tax=Pandoraea terrae TaxID=1537710 RepID=UPI00177BBCBA|nr:TcpQ domain-containing protein [Pandoraea terrae]
MADTVSTTASYQVLDPLPLSHVRLVDAVDKRRTTGTVAHVQTVTTVHPLDAADARAGQVTSSATTLPSAPDAKVGADHLVPEVSPEQSEVTSLRLSVDAKRVSASLREFAAAHGWQLAWEIDRDFPIDYPATFEGSFLEIVEKVALALNATDAPVRVKAYEANRVLRILHATQ